MSTDRWMDKNDTVYIYNGTDFSGGSDGKESACSTGDLGSILGSGRSPAEGNSNTLQYSRQENSMERRAWWLQFMESQSVDHNQAIFTHPVEYSSALKKNEIMSFAATWIDLDIIILSQKEKAKYHVTSLIVECKIWHKWTYLWKEKQINSHREQNCGW